MGRGSPFGNPVIVGQRCPVCRGYHGRPGATIPCYKAYFLRRVDEDAAFRAAVLALEGDLGCFCVPAPCHVEVIVAWLEKQRAPRDSCLMTVFARTGLKC